MQNVGIFSSETDHNSLSWDSNTNFYCFILQHTLRVCIVRVYCQRKWPMREQYIILSDFLIR